VPDVVTAATRARLLDPNSGMTGRLAELNGAIVGFTVSVISPEDTFQRRQKRRRQHQADAPEG